MCCRCCCRRALRNTLTWPSSFQVAQLSIVGNIAPHQVLAAGVPGRAFRPEHSGVESLNRGIADLVFREFLVQDDNVRIGVSGRVFAGPVAFGFGEQCWSSNGSGSAGQERTTANQWRERIHRSRSMRVGICSGKCCYFTEPFVHCKQKSRPLINTLLISWIDPEVFSSPIPTRTTGA